ILPCTKRHLPGKRLNLAHVSVVPLRGRNCPSGRSLLVLTDRAKIRNLWPRREFRLATVMPFPYTCFFHLGGCATVAQWQSTGFVNQGLWVQLPPVASRGKPTTRGLAVGSGDQRRARHAVYRFALTTGGMLRRVVGSAERLSPGKTMSREFLQYAFSG